MSYQGYSSRLSPRNAIANHRRAALDLSPTSTSLPAHHRRDSLYANSPREESTLPLEALIQEEFLCDTCDPDNFDCSWCESCGRSYCDRCWESLPAHRPRRKRGPSHIDPANPQEVPHEKVSPSVAYRLNATFNPPGTVQDQERLHREDEATKWFGVAKSSKEDKSLFQDYGRFPTLMAGSSRGDRIRYPQLVSFVGQAGHGKSTVINLLVEQQKSRYPDLALDPFPVPVVGLASNDVSTTTGEVHLYADPGTYSTLRPMLLADCEGLDGGERAPISVKHCTFQDGSQSRHKRIIKGIQREITWSKNPQCQGRQFAVEQLYPRLLYTFSDVVVFVLNNPKVFESAVVTRLLDWASRCIEKSTNQFTLPHAIIVLNSSSLAIDPHEWEVEHATHRLMSTIADIVKTNSAYQDHVQRWKSRGKVIGSTKELLECYYSSIKVVRIPTKARYTLVDQQVSRLYDEIRESCGQSYRSKRRDRTLFTSDQLNTHLQYAFIHFATNLDAPFNFIEVAFKNNPIPLDFGGNILKLAIAILKATRDTNNILAGRSGQFIFRELSSMVASCVTLDCARHNGWGSVDRLLKDYYMTYCSYALNDFCDLCWTCDYRSTSNDLCVNVRKGHVKGHQDARGRLIGSGHYTSTFTEESFRNEWELLLEQKVLQFQAIIQQALIDDVDDRTDLNSVTATIHRANIQQFYRRLGGARHFFSNSTCFCCLLRPPEHALPCGHVLCHDCLSAYGAALDESRTKIRLKHCPLHMEEAFQVPYIVDRKPDLAGVRILTLDGGGIRGILELEILCELEELLGGKIPVQDFFDLIIGTSTGGIIALGLGVEHWRARDCAIKFINLTDKAFTSRPGFVFGGQPKYKTRPFEDTLRESFGHRTLFGGRHELTTNHHTKVAITSATGTGEQAVIMSNYNRPTPDYLTYTFLRPDDPDHELKIWEAARATSAAPTFFKPFTNTRTEQTFLDGALFWNNPAQIAYMESRILYPDTLDRNPDILLSLGTGHNGASTSGDAEYFESRPSIQRRQTALGNQGETLSRRRSLGQWWKNTGMGQLLSIMVNRVDNLLNAEQMWQDFKAWLPTLPDDYYQKHRYVRLNIDLGQPPPRLDEKKQLHELGLAARAKLTKEPRYRVQLTHIAYQLVSSVFYFHQISARPRGDVHQIVGTIKCRFTGDNLRQLGHFLQKMQSSRNRPHFYIFEKGHNHDSFKRYIEPRIITDMMNFAQFDIATFNINLHNFASSVSISLRLYDNTLQKSIENPISGFPRVLTAALGKDPPEIMVTAPATDTESIADSMTSRQRADTRRNHDSAPVLSRGSSQSTAATREIYQNSASPIEDHRGRIPIRNDWVDRRARGSSISRQTEAGSPQDGPSSPIAMGTEWDRAELDATARQHLPHELDSIEITPRSTESLSEADSRRPELEATPADVIDTTDQDRASISDSNSSGSRTRAAKQDEHGLQEAIQCSLRRQEEEGDKQRRLSQPNIEKNAPYIPAPSLDSDNESSWENFTEKWRSTG